MKKKKTGLFVVVEGIDGTGKSTLVSNLYKNLRKHGIDVLITFEPTHGRWGKKLRQSFTGNTRLSPEEELSLFIKDRKEHLEDTVFPALEAGRVVICDRYYFSTIAYQGARGLDQKMIRRKNSSFALRPDVCFILELPPEEAVKRITQGRAEKTNNFEGLEYLKKVAEIFSSMKEDCIIRLDANLPPEQLSEQAAQVILDKLKEKNRHK
ncbi:MAG: dTMP kinase [Thermodesulfatator sp.]|nr:MAG: dTMP kinase [Thermodesulfatator sp.]